MVPVRNEPEAVPACHERVDIHPVEVIKKNASHYSWDFIFMYL